MAALVSPNGVVADVRDDAVENLLRAGWKRAEEKKPKAASRTSRRRTSRAKQ